MWPLYNFVGSAKTINLAIDIWTKVNLEGRSDKAILIQSLDYNQEWAFENYSQFIKALDPKLQLYQNLIAHFHRLNAQKIEQGFKLVTQSESPIGGGLGGSSSLMVSLLKAFGQFTNYKFKSTHEMVHWAHNIEAELLKTPTGTQDYYPAITGGLSCLEYSVSGVEQIVIDVEKTPLKNNFLLIYTGRSHHSGLNNFEVLKSSVEQNRQVLDALYKIKEISEKMWSAILAQNWAQLPDLFQQEYDARLQLTPAFTSPEIERLAHIGLTNGAAAVKICGAGGGGCVLVWVEPQHRQKVIDACQNEKFQCLNAQPVSPLPQSPL